MLAACGKPVTALEQISMGPLKLDGTLPRGGCRELTVKRYGCSEGQGIGHNRTKSRRKSLSNLLIMPVKIVIILHIKRSMTWQMIPQ